LRREIVPAQFVDRGKSGGDLPRSAALRELLARRFSIAHRAEHNALYPKDCLLAPSANWRMADRAVALGVERQRLDL
jgi:hypothetical protein